MYSARTFIFQKLLYPHFTYLAESVGAPTTVPAFLYGTEHQFQAIKNRHALQQQHLM
jgi:hypothetical protein